MQRSEPKLEVTHTETVGEDQIDDLGHMNVRFYGQKAYAASKAICEARGLDRPRLVSAYTRHHNEQMEGSELEVRTGFLSGGTRLRLYHELRNRADDQLAATFVHELDHAPLDEPTIELPPHGHPRTLDLETDGLGSAPALEELRRRGLALRKPRLVGTEDTWGGDVVSPWLVNNLIWEGERIDDDTPWIRTLPDGDEWAFVVAEMRLWTRLEPVVIGTPIESFHVTLEMGTKIVRDLNLAYDTSTGEVLVAMEAVDLCFNLTQRRSIDIPAEGIERIGRELNPDLAPARL